MDKTQVKKILLSPVGLFIILMLYLLIGSGIFYAIEHDIHYRTDFVGWLDYSVIAVSTIGYGHICPVSAAGRLFTIPFVLIGIPLFFATIYKFGRFFVDGITKMKTSITGRFSKRSKEEQDQNVNKNSVTLGDMVVPSVAVGILMFYVLAGAGILWHIQEWTYVNAIYFIFVSITSMGFGDLYVNENHAFGTSYVIFGMVLLSMVIHTFVDLFGRYVKEQDGNAPGDLRGEMDLEDHDRKFAGDVSYRDVN